MRNSKIVWLIEDNKDEAEKFTRFLEKGGKLNVKTILSKENLSLTDFRKLAIDPNTGAFIIDQRLDMSGVEYTGFDLAKYLRQIKPELRIYMLTSYPEDIGAIGDVEDVIPKSEIRELGAEYVKRILRSIQSYEEAMSNRQKRLDELVTKKIESSLNGGEEVELQRLREEIERPFGLELIRAMNQNDKVEQDERVLLQKISERLRKIEVEAKKRKSKRGSNYRRSTNPPKSRKK